MVKKTAALLLLLSVTLCAVGCKSGGSVDGEIKLPIYGAEEIQYEVAAAQYMDISQTEGIGAVVGYPYAEYLYYPADAQMISYEAVNNRELKQGDLIAELDSSGLDYEISNQQTIVNTAYTASLSGGESERLQYQIEQSKLEMLLAGKESYTIRAPYDCVVTSVNRSTAGSTVTQGDVCCSIAKPEEISVYVEGSDAAKFHFGQAVTVKIDGKEYDAVVAMAPDCAPETADGSAANRAAFVLEDGVIEAIREENPVALTAGWATVYFTESKKNVLAVPDSAINSSGSSTTVTIVDGEERYRLPVTVGVSYGGYTEIRNGISAGDIVLAEGSGIYTTDLTAQQ